MEILLFFNFKILYCNYLPFRSPFMTLYYSSSLSWVGMHWSHESGDIYDFQLAIWVNTNNIGDFFRTKLCPLRDSMRALIGFGRCQIPSPDGPSCSTPIFTHTILLHQLRANSWKYTCLLHQLQANSWKYTCLLHQLWANSWKYTWKYTCLLHQLRANSWKYTCLKTMECLHHVTATCKVLKGLINTCNCLLLNNRELPDSFVVW